MGGLRIDSHERRTEPNRGWPGPTAIWHEGAHPEHALDGAHAVFALVLTYASLQRAFRLKAAFQKTASKMSPIGDDDFPVASAAPDCLSTHSNQTGKTPKMAKSSSCAIQMVARSSYREIGDSPSADSSMVQNHCGRFNDTVVALV